MRKSIQVSLALLGGLGIGYLLRSCFHTEDNDQAILNESVYRKEDSFTPEDAIIQTPANQITEKQPEHFISYARQSKPVSCLIKRTAIARHSRVKHDRPITQLAQITLTNASDKEKELTLWGVDGIKSAPSPEEAGQPLASIPTTGVQPQGLAINPYNNLVYVANQLSDTVTITTMDGAVVSTVSLSTNNFPGMISPVHLAVQSNASLSSYGNVYVVGSVSDTVSIIDKNLVLKKTIPTGSRPVAIAFNSYNNLMYLANLGSHNITVIDVLTEQVVNVLPAGKNPRALCINPGNGDLYIANSADNTITVYDKNNVLVSTINLSGVYPVAIAWHPGLQRMFVIAAFSDEVISLDANTYTVQDQIPVGHGPYAAAYHPGNGYLYVANRDDQTLTIIASDSSIYDTIPASHINNGLVIHPATYALLWTTTSLNMMELTGPLALSPSIVTDVQNITRLNNYFRYNLVELKQVKFVFPGVTYVRHLTVRHSSPTGMKKDTPIALSNYETPRQFLKVFDIDALAGLNMSGNVRWIFTIPPKQTMTMLMRYTAFEKDQLFNQAS